MGLQYKICMKNVYECLLNGLGMKILPLFPENRTEQDQHTEQFQTTDKHKERHDPLTYVGHAAHGVCRTVVAEAQTGIAHGREGRGQGFQEVYSEKREQETPCKAT